ncbi:MAG: alanyl-tRNA editing protein [Bryobacteraceae bacterium]
MSLTRLYYQDAYLTQFTARVVGRWAGGCCLRLDRTAFYPTSGGQPHDEGTIAGVPVVDVIEEGDEVVHVTGEPVRETEVECRIDWPRRFDHMQQHTGQHLLSAVLYEMFGWNTVGFHLGTAASTIDLDATRVSPEQLRAAEERANELIFENRPVSVSFEPADEAQGLRRAPEREGLLRIVTIEGLDRSACGGTHVRATGEIGPVLIRKCEKVRSNIRLEFLCGLRAIRRARADFEALSKIALGLSASLEEAPALVESQRRALIASEKALARVRAELAHRRGVELYQTTPPERGGLRLHMHRRTEGAADDEIRALAQGFTSGPRSVFIAASENPPSLLLAASVDSGLHAGQILKEALKAVGGRGGGNAQLAQGSLPSAAELERVLEALSRLG